MTLRWGATAAAFALWATLVLRSLLRLARFRLADRAGPGPIARFRRDPAFRADRLALGISTLVLAALGLAFGLSLALALG